MLPNPVLRLGLPNPVDAWLPNIPPVVVVGCWAVDELDPNKPPPLVVVFPNVEPRPPVVLPPRLDPNGLVVVVVNDKPVEGCAVVVFDPKPPKIPPLI